MSITYETAIERLCRAGLDPDAADVIARELVPVDPLAARERRSMMTPEQRIAAGYGKSPDEPESRTRSIADGYDPDRDAEVTRLRELGDKLPTVSRLSAGYHANAKRAHEAQNGGDAS